MKNRLSAQCPFIVILFGFLVLGSWVAHGQPMGDSDHSDWESLAAQFRGWDPQSEPEILLETRDGGNEWGRVCGTPPPTEAHRQQTRTAFAALAEELDGFEIQAASVQIPLVFHVLQKPSGVGDVSSGQISDLVKLLNKSFKRKLNIEFYVKRIQDVRKGSWFKKCFKVNEEGELHRKYFRITRKLAVDPERTINIYTCRPSGNVLGFGVYPWSLPEDSKQNAVILHYKAMPGGAYEDFSQGKTGVHEMGHYLGLLHTFYPWDDTGDGCEEPGDDVDDTPYEAEPAYGCPEGRDTCPQEGLDPIENFMDYSDDVCQRRFTRGQRRRMLDAMLFFRPTLLGLSP